MEEFLESCRATSYLAELEDDEVTLLSINKWRGSFRKIEEEYYCISYCSNFGRGWDNIGHRYGFKNQLENQIKEKDYNSRKTVKRLWLKLQQNSHLKNILHNINL